MIAVIDYGAGNIRNVVNAINQLGYQIQLTNDPAEVLSADTVILPGVGAAGDTVSSLKKLNLIEPVRRIIAENRSFMGICIGLQVLFTNTEEDGGQDCLNAFPGMVKKLPEGLKIPHMGWNQVKQKIDHPVFDGIPDNSNFYFVHSYYVDPEDKSFIAGTTEYGVEFCSIIAKGNVIGTQFHPEKSGDVGLKIYDNFLRNAKHS
ncbi:MAG: imidazole glycerol phosphate synthase subunit HisH [Dehalococcoidales bacterium]|nr:MAG: imidazole glycerol phosphate synthase subunit HisH [Dehalococcoidales bacterium]